MGTHIYGLVADDKRNLPDDKRAVIEVRDGLAVSTLESSDHIRENRDPNLKAFLEAASLLGTTPLEEPSLEDISNDFTLLVVDKLFASGIVYPFVPGKGSDPGKDSKIVKYRELVGYPPTVIGALPPPKTNQTPR
jgi:hypothetical protein